MNISREKPISPPNGQAITVEFSKATRNYSRLRIATMPNMPITVDIDRYTPAGSSDMKWDQNYALTSDEKGNAYLYGTFDNNSIVTVKYRGASLATHKFSKKQKMLRVMLWMLLSFRQIVQKK